MHEPKQQNANRNKVVYITQLYKQCIINSASPDNIYGNICVMTENSASCLCGFVEGSLPRHFAIVHYVYGTTEEQIFEE